MKKRQERPSRLISQAPAKVSSKRPARQERVFQSSRGNTYRRPQEGAPKKGWFSRRRGNTYRQRQPRPWSPVWKKLASLTLGLGVCAALCVGLVLAYHQLLTCTWFCIKDTSYIQVEGTKRLAPEDLLEMAQLRPGLSLLALRPSQVERTLHAHPWIERAELVRWWPNRLHLRIQEREPAALVQVGQELYYTDRQGHVLKNLAPGDPHDFPVLTGIRPEHLLPGPGAWPEAVTQAFALMDMLKEPDSGLSLEHISEINIDLERGVSLYLSGLGGRIDLGLKDHAAKLHKFARIWPVLAQQGYASQVVRINLDYPQRVLVTRKGMDDN
jgi:cell division protein FtsQ